MEPNILYGFCHCGCGRKTTVPKKSITARGIQKGVPQKYVHNHHSAKIPVIEDAQPFKLESQLCRVIQLTKRLVAIVNVEDYEPMMKYPWSAQQASSTGFYYAITTERGTGKRLYMHRLIGEIKAGHQTDHWNGNTLDNRRSNLRGATVSQNQANKRLMASNTTGFRGVSWSKHFGKFVGRITCNGKVYALGYFTTPEDAARAYDAKAKELFGPYAKLNFPV